MINRLKQRDPQSHKGMFGRVLVLAGSRGLTGAACLCSQAALFSGAGMVTLGIPSSLNIVAEIKLTEVMSLALPETSEASLAEKAFAPIVEFCDRATIIAVGPGLSRNKETQSLIRRLVREITLPMVIDADGLNALIQEAKILKQGKGPRIITPHPGEMSRLAGVSTGEIEKDRTGLAKKFSSSYNVVTVLKGAGTVVAAPDGRVFVNNTGNPGMATGGTGDVLTGVVAALLGQGLEPFEAAKTAARVHGLAGDLAVKNVGQLSLTPTDVLNNLSQAFLKTD